MISKTITQTGTTQTGSRELPKQVMRITQTGNKLLPEQGDTKEIKETIQKKLLKEKETFTYLGNNSFKSIFDAYLDMRKKIRKPATERAIELILKDLHKHPLEIAIKMTEQSVKNSWQGIFELKERITNGQPIKQNSGNDIERTDRKKQLDSIGTEISNL
jgi:hypothetical protein